MYNRTFVLIILFLCACTGFAARVKIQAELDTYIHPACAEKGLAEGKQCSCAPLYDDLVEQCSLATGKSRERESQGDTSDHVHYMSKVNCRTLVHDLWAGRDPGEDKLVSYYIFLSSVESISTLAAFWAGFSQTFGTRQTMDNMLERISKNNIYDGVRYHVHDIEHASHVLGKVMRDLNWGRQCHDSKHDINLWKSLSRGYAASARARAEWSNTYPITLGIFRRKDMNRARWENQVYVIYNYPEANLESTFLFDYELKLLAPYRKIKLLDFKNKCSQTLIHKIASHMGKDLQNIHCYCPEQNAEQFNDRLEIETVRAIKAAAEDIEKLEAGYAPGIVWKALNSDASNQVNNEVDNLSACQQLCDRYHDCAHFNYYPAGACEILHRKDELKYIHGSPEIISGKRAER